MADSIGRGEISGGSISTETPGQAVAVAFGDFLWAVLQMPDATQHVDFDRMDRVRPSLEPSRAALAAALDAALAYRAKESA